MKIKYTYPSIFQSDPSELQKYSSSLAMLALTPDKNIEVVQELYHPSVWKSFWSQVQSKDLDKININKKFNEDPDNVSWLFKQLVNGLEYIISNGYIFFGLLHYSPRPFGSQIHEERGLFKKKSKFFDDMISKYHDVEIYPTLDKTNCCIEAQFIGTGEKFVRYTDTLENLSMQQIAQMTAYFRGSLTGIFGMNTLPKNMFQFIILSQNLTKESIISPLIFDRNGKNTLERLIKNKKFSPAGGFKLDYGIWGLSNIPQWNTLELLPKFSKHITKYNKYLQAIMANKLSPFPSQIHSDPFGFNFIEGKPEKKSNSAKKIFNQTIEKIDQKSKLELEIQSKETIVEKVEEIKEKEIPKPKLNHITLPKISLEKPKIQEFQSLEDTTNFDDVIEEEYDDVFNKEISKETLFDDDGKSVIDSNNIDNALKIGTELLQDDVAGFDLINPTLMNQTDIFKDLEASLAAMSELDELAQKDEAVSRIFFPPPTLISYANKEGMQIGGSTCLISIGVGRNLWMIPELKRMQMWANFWSQEEVEGNPQIKDFIAMEEKDIESGEELENILQKAFIRIRRNNQIFLGLGEFEGNGFESNVFDECDLSHENIQKLMDIHIKQRAQIEFPKISQDSWIEIKYYGKINVIDFLTNVKSTSALDIADDIKSDSRYKGSIFSGVVCVDQDAAHFFILTDNIDQLDLEEPDFEINEELLIKMFKLLEKEKLTPVSWFKISYGFEGFKSLYLWDEIKEGVIVPIIREKYEKYLNQLIQLKKSEDELRKKMETQFSTLIHEEEEEDRTTDALKCPKCGTENPMNSKFCVACGNQIK